ncbi:MAG: GNAT family N-acetyltransferase [Desulfomonilaceae bacterium]|nr:GNAT family N-acetyltransferase [Desulfomonilaceae bacterium]
MSMSRLVFAPYDPTRDEEVRLLFKEYPHKDYQLRTMDVCKDRMADYLERTLRAPGVQSICLRDNGRLVGLVALQSLPWMSDHFGMKMYAVSHLLAKSDGPLVRARLLRYVIEELRDVDFLDCRIAVDDVFAAQALETCGFRYVGTEVYLGQKLGMYEHPPPLSGLEMRNCEKADRRQVLEIVEATHVHNRFVYDPLIDAESARSLYRRLVQNLFENDQFRVTVARSRGAVEGFIISKINTAFADVVGVKSGSLDLIGVRPETRNRGLGAQLNRIALSEMVREGVQFAAVRTLASNYPALRITARTGFSVTSTSLHFHRWIKRPKAARDPAVVVPKNVVNLTGRGRDW